MNKIITIFLLPLLFISCETKTEKIDINPNQKAEDYQNKLSSVFEKLFIEKNIGNEYIIGNWEKDKTEQHFKYLGEVINQNNEKINLINQTRYEGEFSKKAINNIMVWQDGKYLGYYYITMKNDLPTKFENGFLFFENIHNECEKRTITKIDFRKDIPKKIFRKCKADLGDLYEFQTD